MILTAERRKKTGAFYTPKLYAEYGAFTLSKLYGASFDSIIFYDPFAGEGALLKGVRDFRGKGEEVKRERLIASTLEDGDIEILRSENIKAKPLDFFKCKSLTKELPILKEFRDVLCVYTNPPYEDIKKIEEEEYPLYNRYNKIFRAKAGLALLRIMRELQPPCVAGFFPDDFIQGRFSEKIKRLIQQEGYSFSCATFITPSKTWGLSGNFPIAFICLFRNDWVWFFDLMAELCPQKRPRAGIEENPLEKMVVDIFDPTQWGMDVKKGLLENLKQNNKTDESNKHNKEV